MKWHQSWLDMLKLPAVLLLAGTGGSCALQPSIIEDCIVFEDVGGKSIPLGLIKLPPGSVAYLLSQLRTEEQPNYRCWYTYGDRLVAGEPKNPQSFVYGYIFGRVAGEWKLMEGPPIILAVPKYID